MADKIEQTIEAVASEAVADAVALAKQHPNYPRIVEALAGSFSGVMGLPLFETAQLLAEAGIAPATGGAA
jgi:predicted house-cleaning NTP pyrophosphatase (Maf/HAM1 superfamily)